MVISWNYLYYRRLKSAGEGYGGTITILSRFQPSVVEVIPIAKVTIFLE